MAKPYFEIYSSESAKKDEQATLFMWRAINEEGRVFAFSAHAFYYRDEAVQDIKNAKGCFKKKMKIRHRDNN